MIIFRTDASPKIGFGHLNRCRVLAQELKRRGQSVAMYGPSKAYIEQQDKSIFSHWESEKQWTSPIDDVSRIASLAKTVYAKLLVLDDYRVDLQYQQCLRNANLNWLQFESRLDSQTLADIVLNSEPRAAIRKPANLKTSPDKKLLLGPRYAIIRPSFHSRPQIRCFDSLKQLLILFGAGDDRGAVSFVLDAVASASLDYEMAIVISGRNNPRNEEIQRKINDIADSRIKLKINPPSIAKLMRASDLAVLAGGTATFEAAASSLPMIIISIAKNQESQSADWAALGAAIYLGPLETVNKATLSRALTILADPSIRHEMSSQERKLVDGKGSVRVAKAIINLLETLH